MIKQEDIKKVDSDNGRTYTFELDGVTYEFISVTTVLNQILNKPGLIPWAYNIGIENTVKVLSATAEKLIKEERESEFALAVSNYDWTVVKNHLKEKELTWESKRDAGGDRGTIVHSYLEARIKGENPPNECELFPDYCQSLDKFLDDYQPEFHASELTVVSMKLEYAGTLDALCTITKHPSNRRHRPMIGKEVVLDLKTGSDGKVYPEVHFPQIDAYAEAYVEMNDPEGGTVDYLDGMIVGVGPKNYSPAVNYYPKGCFKPILEVFRNVEKGKAANPNARKKK